MELIVEPLTVVGLMCRHLKWCVLECALERAKWFASETKHTDEVYRAGGYLEYGVTFFVEPR